VTEDEWLTTGDLGALLRCADGIASRRKSHLFALGWLERHRNVLSSRSAWVFDVVRRRADAEDDLEVRERAVQVARQEHARAVERWGVYSASATAILWRLLLRPEEGGFARPSAADECSLCVYTDRPSPEAGQAAMADERRAVLPLARDIFGNPFRPVVFNPRWRTADTVGLARGMYEDHPFDRLPLLADALMDAGCTDQQVFDHCRSEGPHVRGCWLIDLVLGKG
jgi:hypothetical protein